MPDKARKLLIFILGSGVFLGSLAGADLCSVEGVVQNGVTGEPLRKASVLLRGAPSDAREEGAVVVMAATTDASGRYAFASVPPGKYRLIVERTGFVSQQLGGTAALTLADGARVKDINVRLTPQAVIAGRVIDEDGDPVQNAIITCFRLHYPMGRKQWAAVNSQSTNDLGEYRMHGLAPGTYLISATYRTGGPPDIRAQVAEELYAPTFYPGVAVAEMAAPLPVTPGTTLRGVDIPLRRVRTVPVRGKVVASIADQDLRRIRIRFMPRSDAVTGGTGVRLYDDGSFIVSRVAPGSYWLLAETSGRTRLAARVPVEVGTAPIDDLNVTLAPGIDIGGSVDVSGCPGLKVSSLEMQLESESPLTGWGAAPRTAVAEDGSFLLRAVLPDRYAVRVTGLPANCYVGSFRFGNADVTGTMLDIAGPAGPLAITLAGGAGTVDGSVENDRHQPAASATVVLVPEGERRGRPQFYAIGRTDAGGRFTVRGVIPGEYRAYAFERIEPGAYLDPDFMKPFESQGERVTLRENGKESVSPRLIGGLP